MNTWHCISNSEILTDDATGFVGNLQALYNSLDAFMSSRLSGAIIYDVYDLEDAIPRSVIYHFESTISPSSTSPLPHEVAICLSYQGATGSGVIPARHRGRIYLGPWAGTVVDEGTGDAIVEVSVRNGIAAAAETLMDDSGTGGWPWAVFSPTTFTALGPGANVSDATFEVQSGWVDNAFDIVRSRGADATARSLFP